MPFQGCLAKFIHFFLKGIYNLRKSSPQTLLMHFLLSYFHFLFLVWKKKLSIFFLQFSRYPWSQRNFAPPRIYPLHLLLTLLTMLFLTPPIYPLFSRLFPFLGIPPHCHFWNFVTFHTLEMSTPLNCLSFITSWYCADIQIYLILKFLVFSFFIFPCIIQSFRHWKTKIIFVIIFKELNLCLRPTSPIPVS